MRIHDLKAKIYKRCGVKNTAQLKKQYSHVTQGKDLRYKTSWQQILDALENDYTVADLEKDTTRIRQSLHRIGRVLGESYESVDKKWQKINHKSEEDSYSAAEQEFLASQEIN